MRFRNISESYKVKNIRYTGTRENYQINDEKPKVLVLDKKYNPDSNGVSYLGVNLNYVDGDWKKLVKEINQNDNKAGYRFFDFKKKFSKKDLVDEKKARYRNFIEKFPHLSRYIRRYKVSGVNKK